MLDRDPPILIACRDRVSSLIELVRWLEDAGHQRIILVDNDSSYEPLLEYYEATPHTVVRLGQNIGPHQFWAAGVVDEHASGERFVLTDPDVVPCSTCPADALAFFDDLLDRYPDRAKVGFGLRIDDLPARYQHREAVWAWERPFWTDEKEPGVYDAPIDTTFALYREGEAAFRAAPALRTGGLYVARHMPWYSDLASPSAEDVCYHERYLASRQLSAGVKTTWNDRRLPHRLRVAAGDAKPRSRSYIARGARYVRRGFRKDYSGY